MPESWFAVMTAPETSPSPISRMRAPAWRTSPISSAWRSRSRMTAVQSSTFLPLALAMRCEVPGRALAQVDHAARLGADRDLLHVRVGRVEELAVVGDRDHADRVGRAGRAQVGALERIDRDVDLRRVVVVACQPAPTCSPMNSIGASSRSPSPITTVPRMSIASNARRIASTATWSASLRSPRPIRRADASAAASVMRTTSSARLRSCMRAGVRRDSRVINAAAGDSRRRTLRRLTGVRDELAHARAARAAGRRADHGVARVALGEQLGAAQIVDEAQRRRRELG